MNSLQNLFERSITFYKKFEKFNKQENNSDLDLIKVEFMVHIIPTLVKKSIFSLLLSIIKQFFLKKKTKFHIERFGGIRQKKVLTISTVEYQYIDNILPLHHELLINGYEVLKISIHKEMTFDTSIFTNIAHLIKYFLNSNYYFVGIREKLMGLYLYLHSSDNKCDLKQIVKEVSEESFRLLISCDVADSNSRAFIEKAKSNGTTTVLVQCGPYLDGQPEWEFVNTNLFWPWGDEVRKMPESAQTKSVKQIKAQPPRFARLENFYKKKPGGNNITLFLPWVDIRTPKSIPEIINLTINSLTRNGADVQVKYHPKDENRTNTDFKDVSSYSLKAVFESTDKAIVFASTLKFDFQYLELPFIDVVEVYEKQGLAGLETTLASFIRNDSETLYSPERRGYDSTPFLDQIFNG